MSKQEFVQAVLKTYLNLPDAPTALSSHDFKLAKLWFDQGIALLQVQQAMTLAQARRSFRPPNSPPLNPIRSLHYFVPVIREIQNQPMEEGYFQYLLRKLDQLENTQF